MKPNSKPKIPSARGGGTKGQSRRPAEVFEREAVKLLASGLNETGQGAAKQCINAVDWLAHYYNETSNPLAVWEAIFQVGHVAKSTGIKPHFPDWVLGYLLAVASQIVGHALAYPDGDRRQPKQSEKMPNGTTTHYSTYFAGLNAEQRRDVAVEALGFIGNKGSNTFENYRSHLAMLERQRKRERARKAGLRGIAVEAAAADGTERMIGDIGRRASREKAMVKRLFGHPKT